MGIIFSLKIFAGVQNLTPHQVSEQKVLPTVLAIFYMYVLWQKYLFFGEFIGIFVGKYNNKLLVSA